MFEHQQPFAERLVSHKVSISSPGPPAFQFQTSGKEARTLGLAGVPPDADVKSRMHGEKQSKGHPSMIRFARPVITRRRARITGLLLLFIFHKVGWFAFIIAGKPGKSTENTICHEITAIVTRSRTWCCAALMIERRQYSSRRT